MPRARILRDGSKKKKLKKTTSGGLISRSDILRIVVCVSRYIVASCVWLNGQVEGTMIGGSKLVSKSFYSRQPLQTRRERLVSRLGKQLRAHELSVCEFSWAGKCISRRGATYRASRPFGTGYLRRLSRFIVPITLSNYPSSILRIRISQKYSTGIVMHEVRA